MAKRKRIYGKRRRKSPFKINEERKIELQEKIKVLKSEGKSPEEIKQILLDARNKMRVNKWM